MDELVLGQQEFGVACEIAISARPRFEAERERVKRYMIAALNCKAAGFPQFDGPHFHGPIQSSDDPSSWLPAGYTYYATGVRLATDIPARVPTIRDILGLLDFEPLPYA